MEEDTCIQLLNKDMNECLDKGETSHGMDMFLKVNAFRKAISKRKSDNERYRWDYQKSGGKSQKEITYITPIVCWY